MIHMMYDLLVALLSVVLLFLLLLLLCILGEYIISVL